MKVLFLSVSTGGGHLKAAKALSEYIKMVDDTSEILVIDTLKYASPIVNKIIVNTYINMLKLTPKVYGKIYNASDTNSCLVGENLNYLGSGVNALFSFKINKLVKEFKPDIVVCTHPFSLQMVKKLDIPTIAILTDYAMHPLWVKNCIDAYVIPHEFLIEDAVDKGADRQKIYPLGIPIENKFLKEYNRKDILNEFGLEDKTTFLIMGGSLGLGKIEDVFLRLAESRREFQIVVVAGSNQKLKRKLEKHVKYIHSKNVCILNYTDKIDKLMEISDFVITKPGGLTVAESLAKRLPICIISPIPGQEEKNSDFLLNCGVAINFGNGKIDSFLSQIMDNRAKVDSMKKVAGVLAKPNALKDIYNLMCKLIKDNKLKRGVNCDISHGDNCVYTNEKI